jgi:hypothetical protein
LEERLIHGFRRVNLWERDHLEYYDVDGSIILKWAFKR